jgi:CRISPR/Cas system-associated protein Cas10 (large subunit of type III CRISPR-Cas system)
VAEVIEIIDKPLDKAEVLRRVNVLREGNEMSRTAFGNLIEVRWRGDTVRIATTKHTIYISKECWNALGERQV